MYYAIYLVLDDLHREPAIFDAWEKAGVSGITIMDSTGMGRVRRRASLREDAPLFPSIRSLMQSDEEHHRTFVTIVEDDEKVERVIEATTAVLGDLSLPNTGILYVVPVTRVVGVPRRKSEEIRPGS